MTRSQTIFEAAMVWQVVAKIPYGRVATYGQVARLAGWPGYARQVGMALKGLPVDSGLPWHRVINARGRISLPSHSAGANRQAARLQAEGVLVNQGRISLKRFQWEPA